jgi:ADP-heptose:LPS heptosyltransferase
MNVDTMRKIDFRLGVPLCWLGTKLLKIARRKANPAATPGKVLLIELSEMGSTILADPAMRKLQRCFAAELHFLIFSKNRPSLNLLETVPAENIFVIREDSLGVLVKDSCKFLLWSRKRKIDTVIDLELFSRFTALLTGFSGACRRVGFHAFHNEGLYRGDFLTHKVPYNPHMHIAKNFIALVNSLLPEDDGPSFARSIIPDNEIVLEKMQVPDSQKAGMIAKVRQECPKFDERLHGIILFNANASELLPQRCWPAEYYAELAGIILKQYACAFILFTGSMAEREGIAAIVAQVGHPRCINFAGKTTLPELTALYSISEFMLSNDSGPAHFAAVTSMPTYTIFGPETPVLYGPLGESTTIYAGVSCSPCVSAANHRKTSCRDNKCLQILRPGQLLATLQPGLQKLGTMPPSGPAPSDQAAS